MTNFYTAGNEYDVGYAADEVNETFSYRLHSHEDIYEILYMEEGDASFWVEGTIYRVYPGDLVIARSGEMHQMTHNSPSTYKRLVINVNYDFFENNNCKQYLPVFDNRQVGTGNYFSAKSIMDSGLYDALERLKAYGEEDEKPLVKSVLIEIFYILNKIPEESKTKENRGIIREVVIYINENITQPLTLDTIAERFYMSKYYLCREFKKKIGLGISKYITHKRILLVKELYTSGKNLTEACISAGFGDYSSFYIAYKKMYGCSPKNILK